MSSAAGDVIVATKLHIPRRRAGLISRGGLVETLIESPPRKLTLLNAPPGSGKTTLLAEWHAAAVEQRPFAWLSLDEGDNDEVRFWDYVIEALRVVDPGVGDSARSALHARGSVTELVLPLLVNDLVARERPQILVLDDYHLIAAQAVHDGLAYLLEHLPATLQVALATRADPPLPLSRLRARGEVTELRAAELRFSGEEATALLNATLGLGLGQNAIDRLQRRTEGWAAGLYLAALSLRGRADQQDFIESFAGDDRQVVDYLLTEVLVGLPSELRSFMLRTSVLARLSGPLCEAVTGVARADEMLERLERSNLFLVPLDTRRSWYRYHQLFGELLRHELTRAEPELVPELHRRAYRHLLADGEVPEAVRHAAAAGDLDVAGELVAEHWNELFNQGRLATVAGWLTAIGDDAVEEDPRLCVAAAWLALDGGRLAEAERWITQAERGLAAGSPPLAEIESGTATLRAVHSFKTGDLGKARQAALRVIEVEDGRESFACTVGHCILGITHQWSGRPVDALASLGEAERLARVTENDLGASYALGYRATICAELGDLDEAERLAEQALTVSDQPGFAEHFVVMMAFLARGHVRLRRGDLERAESDLTRAVDLSRRRAGAIEVAAALLELSRARAKRGGTDDARRLVAEARQELERCGDPGTIAASAERAELSLRRATAPRTLSVSAPDELTDRELDVLRLLESELSQREIGEALYVSLNTVKSHTRGIFRKLDASNRDEAVTRAHDLGIL